MSAAPEAGRSEARGTPSASERYRPWTLLLGALLIPPNSLWIARAEALDYSGFPTCMSLFYNVIFSLMALLAINAALRHWLPRFALRRQEMLVVYAMVATGSSLAGHDSLQMVVPSIPHVAYFANADNNWSSQIAPLLPSWLTMTELNDNIKAYEQGYSSLYQWDHIQPWLAPMGYWSIFLLSTLGATLLIGLLLRRQWTDNERLTYPVVQIPLMITEGGGSNPIFRSKLMWGGFALSAGIDLLNGLQQFFPSLPSINVKVQDLSPMLAPYPPWNAVGWTPMSFYPFAIGLSFFMPTSLAFSCWFFYFARKAQQIYCASIGVMDPDPWYPYLREQSFGGWIALAITSLWFGRGYVAGVLKEAVSFRGKGDGGVSYSFAFFALLGCMAGMAIFLMQAGLSPALSVTYVLLYLAFCTAAARVRAEAGPPAHEIGWVGASGMLVAALGTTAIGPKGLAVFSLLYFQNRMHRGLLMPQQVECLKAGAQSGLRTRAMFIALAIAGVVGVISAFWAMLHLSYGRVYATAVHPAAPGSAFAGDAYGRLQQWITTPVLPNQVSVFAMAIGALFAVALGRMSVAFHGFPFHPAGYALGMSFGLDYIWMPIMISWAVKSLLLRWRGLAGYRAAIPFFVGLVLGEFAVGGMWSFLRGILGVKTYTFYIW